jgi:two-component system sensor histidine kinase MprB
VSLGTRLALAAAAAVAAAVVLASVIVYFVVRNELFGPINTSLRSAAAQVQIPPDAQPVAIPGHSNEYVLRSSHGPRFERGSGFAPPYRLVTSDGAKYFPNTVLGGVLEPLPATQRERDVAAGKKKPYFFDAHIGGQHARIYTMQYGPRYAVQVATSIDAADRALSKIRLWLLIVALGGVAIASVAGFLVARAALRPVRRLSATAEEVRTTRDLTKRIDVEGNDEVSQLAMTFNAMLASLDEAAQRQRQLVQDASHELRTPLTSLRTNIEVLACEPDLPPDDRTQLLSDVVAQLAEMTALVAELTELARGAEQQPAPEEIRLDLVTEEAIRRTLRNHPDVPIEADLSETTMVGVPATLERAIANLLDNAAKWSPAGAAVEVRLRGGELTVRDRGPGIAEADLPHVFERFYRATGARSMPGSGLGLAIVKQVAEAHGGTVTAERGVDGGTIMRFVVGNGSRNGNALAAEALPFGA